MEIYTVVRLNSHPSGRLTLEQKLPGKRFFEQVGRDDLVANNDRASFWEAASRYLGELANAGTLFRVTF